MNRRRRTCGGFTLVEVVVALAIIGLVAVILIERRVDVVREAAKSRDLRLAGTLAAWKMGEIERDTTLFEGAGGTDSGGFDGLSAEYADFAWESEAAREPVPTNDPEDRDELPKEIFRVRLRVRRGQDAPVVEMEAMFPVTEAPAPPQETPK